MNPDLEQYLAVPNAEGGHLYFPASVVMRAVNEEWEPIMQRAVDSAKSPSHAAMKLTKLRTPKTTARVLATAYAKLIESGTGVSREEAVKLASDVLDPKGVGNGKASEA